MPTPITLSATVLRCNPLRLEEEFRALEAAGASELHFDLSDGVTAPNLGLNVETIAAARAVSGLRCAAHLLLEQPQRQIAALAKAGCHTVLIQAETCAHGHRVLGQIRDAGVSPGVAISPSTPLTLLEYLLPLADRVLVLAAEPGGRAGDPHLLLERVRILHENIRYREYRTDIQVEAPVDATLIAGLSQTGARSLVCDSPADPDGGYAAVMRAACDTVLGHK